MSRRVCTMVMVLVLLAAQAVPAMAGEAVLHSRASDDEWGVEGIAAGQVLEDVQVASQAALTSSVLQLPLYFIENRGDVDERVGYYVQGKDKTLYFTSQGLTFLLAGSGEGYVVKLDFLGANPDVQPLGVDETGAVVSYFKGRPEEWVTGLKTYSSVVYHDLWPGVDLQYSGTVNQLKYQFVVQPGADPSQIKLAYRGAGIAINEAGRLEVTTPAGGFEDGAPYAYQPVIGGEQVEVAVSYELEETLWVSETPRVYGFRIGAYDASRVLVLDPVVVFSCGYIGGDAAEQAYGVAVDSEGNTYVAGYTWSTESTFPDTVGPIRTQQGDADAFVAKVRAGGGSLVYCGYIGGDFEDRGQGIAVDSEGRAYVTGYTHSHQMNFFPVVGGPDLTYNGDGDAFVARVEADGTALDYCGYIGGSANDMAYGIAVDGGGHAYVTGLTSSDVGFPVRIGPDLTYNGGWWDAFVAKVTDHGLALDYCGYIGGSGLEIGNGIAVNASGQAYVTGETSSTEDDGFPVTMGPDLTYNGGGDAFVARVDGEGTELLYCGYIGGSGIEHGHGIALSSFGYAYVAGYTESGQSTFPDKDGPDLTYNGGGDAFVARVGLSGWELTNCGYIGGSGKDIGHAIAVDGDGFAYVTGETASSETQGFPVVGGPDLTYNGGIRDAFVAKVNAFGTDVPFCSYIGGGNEDYGYGIAVEQVGTDYTAHVVGGTRSTQSEGFPLSLGPDLSHNGGLDAFVARIGPNHAPTLGTIDPANGSSAPGAPFYVTTSFVDADGWRDLKHVYFHIGDSPSLVGNVTLMYNRAKNKLWIRTDDGTNWIGGCSPGDFNVIGNSQAQVLCTNTYVSYSGTDTLNVGWYMWFMPGYDGEKKTGLKCKDMHKAKAKGKWKGTWTIGGDG